VTPANFSPSYYRTGGEIRGGDRILWAGRPGTVIFVLGSPDTPAGWANPDEWLGKAVAGGFMLDVDGAGWVFEEESDEDLTFVGRKP